MQGKIQFTVVRNLKCEDKYMTSYIEGIKTKTSIDLNNNKAKIKISGKGKIIENNCKMDLENPETIKTIESDISKELDKTIKDVSYLVQKKYQTDVLGYGKIIHKKQPKTWKKIKNNWDEIFKNLEIETDYNIKIENQGSLIQTIKEEK